MAVTLTFVPLAYGVAFVCTAVKDHDQARIWRNTNKLFAWIFGGIAGFGVGVQVVAALLG